MSKRADPEGAVWGEGFVEDGWSAMAGVDDFARLTPDEYIRLVPGLLPREGRLAEGLVVALAACVAARSRRMHAGVRPSCAVPATIEPDAADRAADGAAQRFLEDILEKARAGDVGTGDPATTARFAYLSGFHPAYLWPGALASHERDTAAGWLGIVSRGRPALMPVEVADVFLDIIECRRGRPVAIRDAEIAGFLGASVDLRDVWRAACARRLGKAVVVRRRRGPPRRGLLPVLRRSLGTLDRLRVLTRGSNLMRNV